MIVKQIQTGKDRNFTYIVADEEMRVAAVIDPGADAEKIAKQAELLNVTITHIINTHGHGDHTGANQELKAMTGATIFGNNPEIADTVVDDDHAISVGTLKLSVIHTPGHTEDSICISVQDHLFTGDTLFVGKIGGTRTEAQAKAEYYSLHEKIMKLPDDTRVWPGHDYGVQPQSTIGHERTTNPFIMQPDFVAFLHLKNNWAEYKKAHGIQ